VKENIRAVENTIASNSRRICREIFKGMVFMLALYVYNWIRVAIIVSWASDGGGVYSWLDYGGIER
jgi:hypothetical protein